jgi:type II secretory pathway pseudopilin PulG
MARKAAKAMIRTFSTVMLTRAGSPRAGGFTLIEAIVMTVLLGLLTGMVMLNVAGFAFSSRSSMETAELVSTLRKAYGSAIQGGKRYEIRLDLAQQSYLLRTLTAANYGEPPEKDEVIDERQLDDQCRLEYVEFDDGVATDQDFNVANFRAGRAGWQRGGRILIVDSSGNEYSIMVNRLTGEVTVEKGNVPMLVTQNDTSQQQ